jgi:hypothetical protein
MITRTREEIELENAELRERVEILEATIARQLACGTCKAVAVAAERTSKAPPARSNVLPFPKTPAGAAPHVPPAEHQIFRTTSADAVDPLFYAGNGCAVAPSFGHIVITDASFQPAIGCGGAAAGCVGGQPLYTTFDTTIATGIYGGTATASAAPGPAFTVSPSSP